MSDRSTPMQPQASFDGMRQIDEDGHEFWSARPLAKMLDYPAYRQFRPVIERAKAACGHSGQPVEHHFEEVLPPGAPGAGARRRLPDVRLSRYACYLIVQNGDPAKPAIALGQTYFALQTRRQELADHAKWAQLSEADKRLALRNELAQHHKQLAAAARQAGVATALDYAIFQDHGYRGLYGGLSVQELHAHKALKKRQQVLDHMGSTELAANLFRATQTEAKLQRDAVHSKQQANQAHYEVGRKVRQTIEELGGTLPEALPTPEAGMAPQAGARKKLGKKK